MITIPQMRIYSHPFFRRIITERKTTQREIYAPLHTEPKEKKTGVISITDTIQEAG